jgi:hypothetical protein
MRVLMTDLLFPNKYAKWRLAEIHSFFEKYDTDLLVIDRINKFSGIQLDFDYDILSELFNLNDYDILIFNANYNYVNKYNINFDGTIFNNLIDASYLLRKKKFNNEIFSINNYEKIYHIFLMNYEKFNNIINYPTKFQYIHLYPGGGLLNVNSLKNLDNNVNIISTQHNVTKFIENNNLKNNILKLYGGPFFYKGENIKRKIYNVDKCLTICFTSMGNLYEKGADKYVEIVNFFYQKYQNINVKFISIGNCFDNEKIFKYQSMDQNSLSDFYYKTVDIIINLDSGKELNGFPLGIEAIIEGCLLLTTDVHNLNQTNNFNFDDFVIINNNNIESIVDKLKYLHDNRDFLTEKSIYMQKKVYDMFNYDVYMKNIFKFFEQ